MTKPIIAVEELSKAYRLGLKEEVVDTMVGAVANTLKAPFKNWKNLQRLDVKEGGESEDILWALRDVSFDVYEGDVIGIIGRNGAGKSTLLKVLSRITEPTSGCVKLRGRVSSLLEVGTGFHPELSGRDNIYMNGTILGMTKREIDRKFDEIVEFSGVEKFLDTPVKRYSSGMQVRLAFAVAAHLEPEILIIDEVLAVGDAEFQKKCLGKMQDVSQSGRTVLFVSHNMAAVTNLCTRGILISGGRLTASGEICEVAEQYLSTSRQERDDSQRTMDSFRESWCSNLITSVNINGVDGPSPAAVKLGDALKISMTFSTEDSSLPPLEDPVMGLVFHSPMKGTIAGVSTRMTGLDTGTRDYRSGTITCNIDHFPFLQGEYLVDVWLGDGGANLDVLKGFLSFDIIDSDLYGTGKSPKSHLGFVFLQPEWTVS